MNVEHLGLPLRPMTRVLGKASNRTYRLETDRGIFAVKQLNPDRERGSRHLDVLRLEQAAFAAGIPMPEPISADAEIIVHRWVDGDPVPEEPVPEAFAFEIGEVLARLHSLGLEWSDEPSVHPAPHDWPELAQLASAAGLPWAHDLAGSVDVLVAIARFVDTCERSGPVVLTHRDIHPWNLLARNGRPVVLDWEISGLLDLAGELGSTALSLSKGPGFDSIDRDVFRSVLDGYVECGGVLPPAGPSWFVFMLEGWLGFTRRNILQCISSGTITGADLDRCHEEVRRGLEGLPDMFHRLPELQELLT